MGFSTLKQEVLESSPQHQKINQNMLIIPPMLDSGHGFAALVKAFYWVSKSIKVTQSETGANRMITKTL